MLKEDLSESVAAMSIDEPPSWALSELPPEYVELTRKIDALRQEARQYERLADVLWCVGEPLKVAVQAVFEAMDLRTTAAERGGNYDLVVELAPERRLLVDVVGGVAPLDKRSPDIARALRAIQEDAGPGDRVAFVANLPCDQPVAMRKDPPATADALRLIQGLGANVITASTLFGLWRYSRQDKAGVLKSLQMLHELDGGIFR